MATLEEARDKRVSGGYVPPPLVEKIVKRFDEAMGPHRNFINYYERNERAYHGILKGTSASKRWQHKTAPKYGFNLIETIVSNTIDEGLTLNVRPAPHTNLPLEEAQAMLTRVDAVSDLLRHEHRIDQMDRKQRPFYLVQAIGSVGIMKPHWAYVEGSKYRQEVVDREIYDEEENLLGTVPMLTKVEEQGVLRDHSTTEVIDPRDFIMHESAKSLQPREPGGAQYLFHRCWYTWEQLLDMERSGYIKNVKYVKETPDFGNNDFWTREQELWNTNAQKDMIEVLEYWTFEDGVVKRALVGNRVVLLRELEDSPFDHREYPFVMSSSMPQPFSWRGVSDVELVAELQEILWEIQNQRLDNLELINNAITLISRDVEDPDAFDFYPGAQWPVDHKDQVSFLAPPYQLAEMTLSAEALIKGDMQNVTSAAPFAGGAETATVDQKTATGASIVMSAAQRRLAAKKHQAKMGICDEANQRLKNVQQFISDKKLVHVLGVDGKVAFREIGPLDIQGEWLAELEPMSESEMRAEKRAEALQLGTMLVQWAPIAGLSGAPINTKEVITWVLKQWGLPDEERFFASQAPPLGAPGAPGGGGGPGGPQGLPAEPNMGVTSETAVDASSPSATGGMSMSPEMAMQRALAMSGAGRNA